MIPKKSNIKTPQDLDTLTKRLYYVTIALMLTVIVLLFTLYREDQTTLENIRLQQENETLTFLNVELLVEVEKLKSEKQGLQELIKSKDAISGGLSAELLLCYKLIDGEKPNKNMAPKNSPAPKLPPMPRNRIPETIFIGNDLI